MSRSSKNEVPEEIPGFPPFWALHAANVTVLGLLAGTIFVIGVFISDLIMIAFGCAVAIISAGYGVLARRQFLRYKSKNFRESVNSED